MRLIILCIAVFICSQSVAQTFSNRYDLFDTTFFETRSILADEYGITVLGQEIGSGFANRLWFIRITDNGILEFEYPYGIENREHYSGWQNSFNRLEDGYILGGASAALDDDVYFQAEITKFDFDGNLVWQVQFGDSLHNDMLFKAIPAIDGGIIAIGQTNGETSGSSDILIIKTDDDGNLEWTKTWGSPTQWEIYVNIEPYGDSHYLIGGLKDITPGNPKGVLKLLDLNGNEVDSFSFLVEGQVARYLERFEVLQDLSILLTTEINDPDINGEQLSYIVKIDNNLDLEWYSLVAGENNHNYGISEEVSLIDELVYCGITNDSGSQSIRQGFFGKVDSEGLVLWFRTYTFVDNGANLFFCLDKIEDGFVACGMTLFVPGDEPASELGEQDLWVVRVDSMGCLVPGCQVGIDGLVHSSVGFKAYPNPCANMLNIYFDDLSETHGSTIRITDAQGREVDEFDASLFNHTYIYNTSNLSNGMYYFSLFKQHQFIQSEKIIVQK